MRSVSSNLFCLKKFYRTAILINMFRLRYATLYKQQHPQAKQVEVAEQSGYISDQALSRAKKNVTSIDMDMVKNVTIETE